MKKVFLTALSFVIFFIFSYGPVFAQKGEYVKQVIISNGGVFEFPPPPPTDWVTIQNYNPDTKTSIIFDTIYTQSTQDVLIRGNIAYVAAQDSIVMYNLDTYERIAAVADSGISRLGYCNGNLIVSKQYPITRFYAEVLDGANLALLARIQNISGECGGIVVAGDSLYIAVNYGFASTTGSLAVINPQNWQLVREIPLGNEAKGINDLYSSGNYIWGVGRTPYLAGPEGGIIKYNYFTGVFDITMIPYLISEGFGINGDLLYLVMDYSIGTYNLTSGTVLNPTLIPDPGSADHIYFVSEALDYVNGLIYANLSNYGNVNFGFISTLTGDSVGSYATGISPEAMAIDFRIPEGIQENRENTLSFSVYPNPFDGQITITFNPNADINKFRISDVTGREVFVFPVDKQLSSTIFYLQTLPPGVYLLTAISGNGVLTKKIIKR